MVIGILGGSFCPPTVAHVELSRECIKQGLCDKVIWVPVNDFYKKKTNISSKHRINMINLALKDESNISVSLHEMNVDHVVYTIDSLKILQNIYPNDKLLFIAGADKMHYKWFQSEEMLSKFGYIVSNRDNINCQDTIKNTPVFNKYKNNIKIVDFSSSISSSIVREELKQYHKSDFILPIVEEYIYKNNLFIDNS